MTKHEQAGTAAAEVLDIPMEVAAGMQWDQGGACGGWRTFMRDGKRVLAYYHEIAPHPGEDRAGRKAACRLRRLGGPGLPATYADAQ